MITAEKVQLVIDIANEQRPVQDLRLALEDGATENFIKTAVDYCVQSTTRKAGGGSARFRFKITEHGQDTFTDWLPELNQFSTSSAMGQLRLQHPHAAIAIERQYV